MTLPHIKTLYATDYVGCFLRYSLVVQNQSSKWYELKDKAVFLGQHYPTYANGASYAISSRSVSYIMQNFDSLKVMSNEGKYMVGS